MIFDPLGFACPFTLLGKIYLRETCSYKLGWDDQLPTELSAKWVPQFGPLLTTTKLNWSTMAAHL